MFALERGALGYFFIVLENNGYVEDKLEWFAFLCKNHKQRDDQSLLQLVFKMPTSMQMQVIFGQILHLV